MIGSSRPKSAVPVRRPKVGNADKAIVPEMRIVATMLRRTR